MKEILRLIAFIIIATLLINSPMTQVVAVSNKLYVIQSQGDVKVVRNGSSFAESCYSNMDLFPGDIVNTGRGASVSVAQISETSFVSRIGENTLIGIRDGSPFYFELSDGELLTKLEAVKDGGEFLIRTPVGACGARGTAWSIKTNGANETVSCFESKIFYRMENSLGDISDEEVWIENGFKRELTLLKEPGQMKQLSPAEIKAYEAETANFPDLERLHEEAAAKRGIVEINAVGTHKD